MSDIATFGGGCFWCLDAQYRRIKGVKKVVSGYSGGSSNPTYEQVSTGRTGHAEVVRIQFYSNIITYETLLEIFWFIHNPTTPNRQGADIGPQYRSVIFYHGEEQKKLAQMSKREVATKLWDEPIVTEIVPFEEFYPAEDYHQDYYNKNPNAGYCQAVINPKLAKFSKKFSKYLKTEQ